MPRNRPPNPQPRPGIRIFGEEPDMPPQPDNAPQAPQPAEAYHIPNRYNQQMYYNGVQYQVNADVGRVWGQEALYNYDAAGQVNNLRLRGYDVVPIEPTQDELRERSRLKLKEKELVLTSVAYNSPWDRYLNVAAHERLVFHKYLYTDQLYVVCTRIAEQDINEQTMVYMREEQIERWFAIKRSLPSWF